MFNSYCSGSNDGLHYFEFDADWDHWWASCEHCDLVIESPQEIIRLVNAASAMTGNRAKIAAGLLRHMVGESSRVYQDSLEEFHRRLVGDEQ